ncbi:MAG TPA: hypothetical protein PKE63_08255 [Lacibacter sp.]|nr:hypothetical protein [Lacibacter sp.]HMO89093.1 hypothetical protein [Lacibacter sp.]HMP87256.1 hypothetical protein [Lacibacter sp.]
MIIRWFILTLSLCALHSTASAQAKGTTYETALGVKFYPGAGVTVKHFVKNNAALEGIGYFWRNGMRITGLYEFHGDINGAPGLKWYAGPGIHLSAWNDRWRNSFPVRRGGSSFGIDGVLGLDYKFKGAPLNMSLDWQPSFDFTYDEFGGNWGGFSLRYTF